MLAFNRLSKNNGWTLTGDRLEKKFQSNKLHCNWWPQKVLDTRGQHDGLWGQLEATAAAQSYEKTGFYDVEVVVVVVVVDDVVVVVGTLVNYCFDVSGDFFLKVFHWSNIKSCNNGDACDESFVKATFLDPLNKISRLSLYNSLADFGILKGDTGPPGQLVNPISLPIVLIL